jgi:C-5 cytosine-specific DNA methylase
LNLAIDLYCGLGGWAEGFLAEGYTVVGFDIERHDYGTGGYPGHLVLQDVMTLHGSQFKDAAVIVASPPCQAYSYRAMPWKKAKALPPPDNTLFETCFRLQREASEAACRYIPLIVENVRGAQKWVGKSAWNFGSFHLWGDVPALMPIAGAVKQAQIPGCKGGWFGSYQAQKNAIEGVKQRGSGREWFAGEGKISRMTSSHSPARKAASAMIAKIPFPLAQHIARVFKSDVAGSERALAQQKGQ